MVYLSNADISTSDATEEELALVAGATFAAAANQKNAHKALRLVELARKLSPSTPIDLYNIQVIFLALLGSQWLDN